MAFLTQQMAFSPNLSHVQIEKGQAISEIQYLSKTPVDMLNEWIV